jgi:hypothetical protein
MMIGLWKNMMKLIMQIASVENKWLTHMTSTTASFTGHKVEHEMV